MLTTANDLSEKVLTFTQQNVSAAMEFGQRLARAASPVAALKLQSEFFGAQIDRWADQAAQLFQVASPTAEKKESTSTNEPLEERYADLSGTATASIVSINPATAPVPHIADSLLPRLSSKKLPKT